MNRGFVTLVALLLAGSAAWAAQVAPSSKGEPGPPAMSPTQAGGSMAKEVEGRIKTMDRSGKRVTLEDGTRLTIPDSLKAARGSLKQGMMVKATYEEKGGEKVVTLIQLLLEEQKPKP